MQKAAILYDASQAILSTFDLDKVLDQVLSVVQQYFGVDKVAILLMDSKTRKLSLRSEIGGFRTAGTLPQKDGIVAEAARKKQPVYIPDVSKNLHYVGNFPETRCELAIPL